MEHYFIFLFNLYNNSAENIDTKKRYEYKCKIVEIFETLGGKISTYSEEDFIWMELRSFFKHFASAINNDDAFQEFVRNFNPYEAVSQMITNHPEREKIYISTNYYNIQHQMTEYSAKIASILGFFTVNSYLPVIGALQPLKMGAVFLTIILNLVVALLATISAFLIYSLLIISVETRSYEMAMLRMLGINKAGLAGLILVQAMLFVFPAFILAFSFSIPGLALGSAILKAKFRFTLSIIPSTGSLIWALCVEIGSASCRERVSSPV